MIVGYLVFNFCVTDPTAFRKHNQLVLGVAIFGLGRVGSSESTYMLFWKALTNDLFCRLDKIWTSIMKCTKPCQPKVGCSMLQWRTKYNTLACNSCSRVYLFFVCFIGVQAQLPMLTARLCSQLCASAHISLHDFNVQDTLFSWSLSQLFWNFMKNTEWSRITNLEEGLPFKIVQHAPPPQHTHTKWMTYTGTVFKSYFILLQVFSLSYTVWLWGHCKPNQ